MTVQGLLVVLGARLRQLREASGKSVTATARAAGLSRRYLTEAEAGRANPSILVLARLAAELRVSLKDLLDFPLVGKNAERIALVGLRGAGKSSVGRLLAQELEVPFVELDGRVEESTGLSLAEIFDLQGQDAFHRFEAEALEQVLSQGERIVIATGGSIVDSHENYQRLRDKCRTVWLRAKPEEHFQRVVAQGDRRPMKGNPRAMDELRAILKRRDPYYRECDSIVDTSGRTPAQVAREILDRCARG